MTPLPIDPLLPDIVSTLKEWNCVVLEAQPGAGETTRAPAVAGGRVRLVVHLLAPSQRPVQVTSDLAGFWERHYPAIRRELMRRYPKHKWPENPYTLSQV